MQGQWIQCPTCRQPTAAGYACQRCGSPLQVPMGMPMAQMPYAQPQSSGMSGGVIAIIIVGVVLALGLFGLVGAFLLFRSDSSSSSSPSSYSSPASTGRSSGGSHGAPKIGDEVDLDDSTWTVVDVKDLGKHIKATSELFADEDKRTTGKFVQVHYKVTNDGKKQEVLLDTPKIVDSKKREFGPMQGESEYVPKGTKTAILETLQPSMERDFYTIIEIPADATDLSVQFTGLGLTGSTELVDIDM